MATSIGISIAIGMDVPPNPLRPKWLVYVSALGDGTVPT